MAPAASEPGRTCLGCRRQRPRTEMIRMVRDPAGELVFDPDGRLPGRGAWVCPAAPCLDALNAGALGHVLRGPVALPAAAERRATLADSLGRRLHNLFAMARKTRAVVSGRTGVRAALRDGRASLLLLADDQPSADLASWHHLAGELPSRTVGTAEVLGALAGREACASAAVCNPGFAAALVRTIDARRAILTVSCDNKDSVTTTNHRYRRGAAPRREEATGR